MNLELQLNPTGEYYLTVRTFMNHVEAIFIPSTLTPRPRPKGRRARPPQSQSYTSITTIFPLIYTYLEDLNHQQIQLTFLKPKAYRPKSTGRPRRNILPKKFRPFTLRDVRSALETIGEFHRPPYVIFAKAFDTAYGLTEDNKAASQPPANRNPNAFERINPRNRPPGVGPDAEYDAFPLAQRRG